MKRKELFIIGAVALITALISIVISGSLFGSPKKNPIKVPVVDKISSEFPNVSNDESYAPFYNENALNPTQLIKIGDNSNTKPFPDTNQ